MLDVRPIRDDSRRVPLTHGTDDFFRRRRRHQIVERCQSVVAVMSMHLVRMLMMHELIFKCRAIVLPLVVKVFDAAVCAWR